MSYRQILITKPAKLSAENQQLLVECEGNENKIPIEDICVIFIESREVLISSYCMSTLAKAGVVIHFSDQNHLPVCVNIPLNVHYRPYEVFQLQKEQTKQVKSYVAEMLLKAKIANQYNVAKYCRGNDRALLLLKQYEEQLVGNDFENREGTAAKVFFNALYGSDFLRFEDDVINSVQNYGYGVLRSAIAQSLTKYGFSLYIGVNHVGMTNALNLVYDFIEPYRSLVDYYCFQNLETFSDQLTPLIKKEIVYLLNTSVSVENKTVTVQYSIDMLVRSYLRLLEVGDATLKLPKIEKIDFNKIYESI